MATTLINGISLAYESYGPVDGLPVILLHAFPLSGTMWADQATALNEELGCHVIVPDLRGFGASDSPNGPYTMEAQASDVVELAESLGLGRFVLGGLSMGGYIALAVLRMAAERVRGVVLADTRAGADSDEVSAGREALALTAEHDGVAAVADAMMPRLLTPHTLHHRPEIVAAVREQILANTPTGIAGAARGMALRADATDLLPSIICPALIVVGELDTPTPVSEARILFEHIPDATLAVLQDAGHLSNLEEHESFNSALIHFISGLNS